jgi:hypothetical protein
MAPCETCHGEGIQGGECPTCGAKGWASRIERRVKHHWEVNKSGVWILGPISFIGSAWLTIFRWRKGFSWTFQDHQNLSLFSFSLSQWQKLLPRKARKVPVTNVWACTGRAEPIEADPCSMVEVTCRTKKGLCKWWGSMPFDLLSSPILDWIYTGPL